MRRERREVPLRRCILACRRHVPCRGDGSGIYTVYVRTDLSKKKNAQKRSRRHWGEILLRCGLSLFRSSRSRRIRVGGGLMLSENRPKIVDICGFCHGQFARFLHAGRSEPCKTGHFCTHAGSIHHHHPRNARTFLAGQEILRPDH